MHAGLPYKLVGAQRFYGRREVKDIISFLRLVHNPADEVSLTRVINVPPRGVGAKTVVALRTRALQERLSMGMLLLEMAGANSRSYLDAFPGRTGTSLAGFGRMLADWRQAADQVPPLNLLDRILADVDYQAYIDDNTDEGRDRWENVNELRRLASEFQQEGLTAFLEQVALVSDQDTLEAGSSVPTLLTLHAAKGLEYPVVFIVGLNDGTLPHSRSFDDPDGMQEERRLFYVGITRAKDRLYLLHAQNRSLYGYSEPADPSRFLDDIPARLLDDAQPLRSRRPVSTARSYSDERWQPAQRAPLSNPTPAPVVQQRFPPGATRAAQRLGGGHGHRQPHPG